MEKGTLSERVLACAVKVHKTLGVGFLERVYENALIIELRKIGISVEQQKRIPVYDDRVIVGDFVADIIVNNTLIIELKAVSGFCNEHTACCINYLKATNLPVCLLLNFGKTALQIKRIVGDSYANFGRSI